MWPRNAKLARGLSDPEADEGLRDQSLAPSGASLMDATMAYLCLPYLQTRRWWGLRTLSRGWKTVLEGDGDSSQAGRGLLAALAESLGPLRSANDEVTYAGDLYSAAHHGRRGVLQALLQPLSLPGWARKAFVTGVVREALNTCAVAGDVGGCEVLLALTRAPLTSSLRLTAADAARALEAAEEWECLQSGSPTGQISREKVGEMLRAAMEPSSPAFRT